MQELSLVVYHNDPKTAQHLLASLSRHFESVRLARDCKEVRPAIAGNRADILILDLEASRPEEIGYLHREFPRLSIVATHRLADEKLWTEALEQGATDVCEPRDVDVLRSVLRERSHRAAA
jgi:DNA-binding NtrC family response regulator